MFDYARTDTKKFKAERVVSGTSPGDYHSYRIIYAGNCVFLFIFKFRT